MKVTQEAGVNLWEHFQKLEDPRVKHPGQTHIQEAKRLKAGWDDRFVFSLLTS